MNDMKDIKSSLSWDFAKKFANYIDEKVKSGKNDYVSFDDWNKNRPKDLEILKVACSCSKKMEFCEIGHPGACHTGEETERIILYGDSEKKSSAKGTE